MQSYTQESPAQFKTPTERENYVEARGRNGYIVINEIFATPYHGFESTGNRSKARLDISIFSKRPSRRPPTGFVGPADDVIDMLESLLAGARTALAGWTKQAEHRHLVAGAICPACASDQIVGEEVSIDGTEARQECHCCDCGADWVDTYTLSSCVITGKKRRLKSNQGARITGALEKNEVNHG